MSGALEQSLLEAAEAALARWRHDPHALVQVLRETQARTHWLPRPLLAHIAQALGLTLAQVEGVASFYRFFHLRPVGRYRILFSDNITDRMLGSEALLAQLCAALGVAVGETSANGRVSVDRASCTGLCDQGPALLVNHQHVITRLDAGRVATLAGLIQADAPVDAWPAEWFRVEDTIRRADVLLGGAAAPGCGAGCGCGPQSAGAAGRGGLLGPARSWWRRFSGGPQMDPVPRCARRLARGGLQRRRGRTRYLQGPRAAEPPRRRRVRWHGGRGARHRCQPGLAVPAR